MALLTSEYLVHYKYWVGQTADTIYASVLAAGGWKKLFPDYLPKWASRVRNYFNHTPSWLKRLTGEDEKKALAQVQHYKKLLECWSYESFNRYKKSRAPNPWGKENPDVLPAPAHCPKHVDRDVKTTSFLDEIAIDRALKGGAYRDQTGRTWFQMDPGSTIYHWGEEVKRPIREAIYVSHKGQAWTPVFKLVSLDNTGGSVECIISNLNQESAVAKVDQKTDLKDRVITHEVHQGSYNYSETVYSGLKAHQLRDVETHRGWEGFYVNPRDPLSPLNQRVFPKCDRPDSAGQPLADQFYY